MNLVGSAHPTFYFVCFSRFFNSFWRQRSSSAERCSLSSTTPAQLRVMLLCWCDFRNIGRFVAGRNAGMLHLADFSVFGPLSKENAQQTIKTEPNTGRQCGNRQKSKDFDQVLVDDETVLRPRYRRNAR